MSGAVLTGRQRYREQKRWFRKPIPVLQVEVEGLVCEYLGGHVDCELRRWWIDAKLEHLTVTERAR